MSRVTEALERVTHKAGMDGHRVLHSECDAYPVQLLTEKPVQNISSGSHLSSHILQPGDAYKAGWERFRFLEHNLRRVRDAHPLQRILVTSSVPNEGKTLVAINLAVTLARNSSSVLFVDADLRQPGTCRTLDLPEMPGLAECLERRADLASTIRRLVPFGFYYLASGCTNLNPLDLLQRSGTREWLGQLRGFEWAIIDSPPIEPFADARCIATNVDGVLVVLRAGLTTRADLKDALAILGNERPIGLVFNGCDNLRHDGYYSRYRSESKEEPVNEEVT